MTEAGILFIDALALFFAKDGAYKRPREDAHGSDRPSKRPCNTDGTACASRDRQLVSPSLDSQQYVSASYYGRPPREKWTMEVIYDSEAVPLTGPVTFQRGNLIFLGEVVVDLEIKNNDALASTYDWQVSMDSYALDVRFEGASELLLISVEYGPLRVAYFEPMGWETTKYDSDLKESTFDCRDPCNRRCESLWHSIYYAWKKYGVILRGTIGGNPTIGLQLRINIMLPPLSLKAAHADAIDSRTYNLARQMDDMLFHLYPPETRTITDVALSGAQPPRLVPAVYPIPDTAPVLQPEDLIATMLPFQKRAVGWMLWREGVTVNAQGQIVPRPLNREDDDIPILYDKIETAPGIFLYVHRMTGSISVQRPAGQDNEREVLGGILADEMGLGKTVMLIALLLLHRYEKPGTAPQSNKEIIPSASTLVITPSAILEQWVSELGRHAPSLGVTVYDGNESVSPTDLSSYDIVLTTYDTLRKDLNAAMPDNERPRRHARAHPRRKSPLMGLHWFRVVLDEAQMVESSVNKAAKMARMLPRVHPWAVTGTPIGKNGWNDLRGLISFLGIEPFTSYKHIWNRLTNPVHRLRLIDVLRRFMHRNLKRDLRSELTLPPQHENTLHLDFSRVERTWYNQQFDEMMDAVQEARTSQEKEELAGKLRGWLLQLRQTCCHPQVGTRNRSVLGGTLRSIDEVLDVMHKQTNNQILLYERQIVQARINKAQLLEFKSKADEWANAATVVGIYETTLQQVRRVIKDLEEHIAETEKKQSQLSSASDNQDDAFEIDENDEMSRKGDMDTQSDLREDLQSATGHLRTWQELEHRVTYFLACLFHSIGDEASENKGYIEAEEVRLRILRPVIEDVTKMIERFRAYTRGLDEKMAASRRTRLADTNLPHAGFVIGNALSGLDDLSGKLEGQWDEIMSWRKVIVDALLAPLNETSVESLIASGNKEPPSVEEYQKGVDTQSRADVYQAAYQLALADRRQLLTGFRVSEERSTAVTENEKDKELRLQLEQTKKQFVLPFGALPAKDLVAELKKLEQRDLPAIEKRMLSNALQGLPKAVEKEIANLTLLEREVHAFSKLFNLRVGYFRHLQRISDGVVPLEEPPMKEIDEDLKKLDPHEAEVQQLLVNQLSRKRYLQNLMKEERERANAVEKTWECLVCKTAFTEGVVTPCGHIYCAECSAAWIKRYRKCPLCNQPVQVTQCTPVSLRGTLSNPASQSASSSSTGSNSGTTNGDVGGSSATEQSSANYILLGHLANIPLKGSYGTKLDTLIRHLRYLRLIDPTAKSLVFSQWEHVLDILSEGLTRNGIEFVKLEKSRSKNKRDALKRFRDDNDVEVFMLNARSQSSGLTLVSANHVFLVEPVVNIGLEEQAIGRVHRIGQTRETTVWRYIVRGTVEERVHAVGRAARRRLVAEQLQRDNGGGKSPVFEEEDVEVNVRMVGLENRTGGGGEQVGMRDVRYCLFGEGMNLSELEEEADGTPDISSPAGPGEDNTPMEVAPTSILTLPVELDDEAKAYVTSLQKKTWGDILEDDDSPIVPVTKGRGRMGRKRHIVDRTALLR